METWDSYVYNTAVLGLATDPVKQPRELRDEPQIVGPHLSDADDLRPTQAYDKMSSAYSWPSLWAARHSSKDVAHTHEVHLTGVVILDHPDEENLELSDLIMALGPMR